ncbi:hypothetical protein NPS53_09690 [Pseudomonas putida]|uniref:hypothetical protein n=1 Tax=Pseudomonas putida TaxID=303 RepID=UPI002363F8E1|nr:hypothetical protein [Pseudomonas putida]MDD2139850.1 hypothetical protein [Pseudomonas putida]HDS1721773.1 hypothetical protein [Pseudomonas putida]
MPYILNAVNKPVPVALGSPEMLVAANVYLTEAEAKHAQREACPHQTMLGNSSTGKVCCADCGLSQELINAASKAVVDPTHIVGVPAERALCLVNLLADLCRSAAQLADNSEDTVAEITVEHPDFVALDAALGACNTLPELPDGQVRDGWLRAVDELRGMLLTGQCQGQVVSYQCRTRTTRADSQWREWAQCTKAEYDQFLHNPGPNRSGIMREVRALYTFAQPGEMELLREKFEICQTGWTNAAQACAVHGTEKDELRAQLAGREKQIQSQPSFIHALDKFEAEGGTFVRLHDVLDALATSVSKEKQS